MTISNQVSRRSRHTSRVRVLTTAFSWLALLYCGNEHARASSLIVEVVPSQIHVGVPPGFSGTLELDLLNPAGNTQSFQVAGFQFELLAPAGSEVLFTNATTATVLAPYIFSGDSVADTDFGGSLIISPPPPPPTDDLLGFDTVATPGAFTTLKPGATYGLGLISFSVDANATSKTVPIQIIPFSSTDPHGTQISDPNGGALPFVTSDALITVHAGAIPEPSSIVLALSGVAVTTLAFWARRGARSDGPQIGSQGGGSGQLALHAPREVGDAVGRGDNPKSEAISLKGASVHRRARYAAAARDQSRSPRLASVSTGRP